MKFDAVIFDWGGTLTPWHTIDALHCWVEVTGDAELAAALVAAEAAVWRRSRDHHLSATLDDIANGAAHLLTVEQRRRYYHWWDEHTLTDPAAIDMLVALRRRDLRIGVLSNTVWSRAEHERIFHRDGIAEYIDAAVYSSEIAWTKPHPEAFRAALSALGVHRASRAVFVGDRLFDDIHGAQQAGLATVYLPHSDIPQAQRGAVEGSPDATIESLAELVEVIDRWQQA